MKNKRLMGIIGLIAAAVIGTAIYSATAGKDNKAASSNEKAKVGVLQLVSHPSLDLIYKGIQDGLAEEGYDKDKVDIDFLNAEGDQNKVATMSKQLVDKDNQVLIGIATPSAQGLASATKDKPIVMGAVTDPVGANLVKDLKKPGGNITGVSDHNPTEQQLKLIKELTPNVKTIGILYDNTIASAFSTVVEDNKTAKKPIFPSATAMVEAGGLGSVVVDQHDLGVATGKMAAKILKGQKPADTPVEIFSQGKSVINKKVADELGITIPESVLKDAGQVIK